MSTLDLALLQTHTHWHDPAANRALFDDLLPAVEGAALVVLPEMWSTGFTMDAAGQAEPDGGDSLPWMQAWAARLDALVCGSLSTRLADGAAVNRFFFCTPDGGVQHYDKRHCFRMAGEHETYRPGAQRVVVTWRGWRILPQVCYDLRFPAWSRNRGDYDLALYTANWPAKRQAHWDTLLRARAIENLSAVAGVNILGTDGNGVAYAGGTALWGADGEAVLPPTARPGVYRATLDLADITAWREQFPAWQDADTFTLET